MSAVDENFEDFVSNWSLFKDKLVIFLGAGASIGAQNTNGQPLPNAYELRNALWKKYKVPDGHPFNPEDLRLMSLEHASAIIEAKVGRNELSNYLTDTFLCDRPLWSHVALPALNPKAIFTTNYDELVELGYKHSQEMHDVICDDHLPTPNRVPIYKPHGSLSRSNEKIGKGGLVITQFDYFDMISNYRNMLKKTILGFEKKCVLVIGYSFGDMDIGSELYHLRRESSGVPWYAVFPRADPQVKKMYSKRLEIEQINNTFEGFLAELDERVGFIPREYKHSRIGDLKLNKVIQ
ncbi:SIR2 family NAD-dependent protein deacylase [Sinorhizobium fredii]|uniref:SIR2 family NAD-dependent protein deacylase n=1 Tax=Rhizobium fredii TaxID=380 RepID=UPI003514D421